MRGVRLTPKGFSLSGDSFDSILAKSYILLSHAVLAIWYGTPIM